MIVAKSCEVNGLAAHKKSGVANKRVLIPYVMCGREQRHPICHNLPICGRYRLARRRHLNSPKEGAEMDIAFLVGRIIFGGYWLMASFNHFKNLNYMSEYAKARGTPSPKLAVGGTGVI